MRIVILHNRVSADAAPDEMDVLVQVEAVGEALISLGHAVEPWGCDLDLESLAFSLSGASPDLVFNLVEGLEGHGRLIHLAPGVLEALRVPLAGCPAEAIFLTSHKVLAKGLLRQAGLPTPDWLADGLADAAADAGGGACGRWIVKSVWEDASLGMDDGAVVDGGAAAARVELARRQGRAGSPWFAEAFVEGREFNLGLLDGPDGPTVLPAAEITFEGYPEGKPRIVGYAAKWHEDSFEYRHTVRRFDLPSQDEALAAEMTRLALACWRLFRLRGWARVDFRVDADGHPFILEVNANPCLSPDAGYAAALERAGIPFADAVGRIVAAAHR
ncbi:MAG: D-alanine--D-alanine ligase [bacterium]|nr:D-alanine--D-alanine ligase [bacterium]